MKLSKLRHATATRHLAGATIPRQDTTSFGMRAAMKKGGSRYAGEAGEVEGKAARPRLDRPGRKAGGRVCKADGGETVEPRKRAAGELDEGAQRNYLKSQGAKDIKEGEAQNKLGVVLTGLGGGTALGAGSPGAPRRLIRALGAGAAALGVQQGVSGIARQKRGEQSLSEAKEFDKADTAEKKFGGRAKAKSKDRDGDDD